MEVGPRVLSILARRPVLSVAKNCQPPPNGSRGKKARMVNPTAFIPGVDAVCTRHQRSGKRKTLIDTRRTRSNTTRPIVSGLLFGAQSGLSSIQRSVLFGRRHIGGSLGSGLGFGRRNTPRRLWLNTATDRLANWATAAVIQQTMSGRSMSARRDSASTAARRLALTIMLTM